MSAPQDLEDDQSDIHSEVESLDRIQMVARTAQVKDRRKEPLVEVAVRIEGGKEYNMTEVVT